MSKFTNSQLAILKKALKKIRKSEGELDAEVWSRQLEEKWQRAMDKFERVVRRKEAKEEVKMMKKEEKAKKVQSMLLLADMPLHVYIRILSLGGWYHPHT